MVSAAVAEQAVQATLGQARLDASADLQGRLEEAHEAARDRAVRLVSTARPGARSAYSRYDAAARVLREWYLSVHDATLEQNLGGPARTPDAAAVEATAAQVGRIRTGEDPQGPLRATALVWRVAQADADAASVATLQGLRASVHARAAAFVDRQAGVDELRGPILRHWYQRCYLEAVDAQLGLLRPLEAVTQGEVREVAASVEAGQARRIIGADGVPLVTAQGTKITEADRRLAAGETGVIPAPQPTPQDKPNQTLRRQVTHSWAAARPEQRAEWANAAGVPHAADQPRWSDVPGDAQSRLIARWLDDHRDRFARPPNPPEPPPLYAPFTGTRHQLRGPSEEAAARMFGHQPHPSLPQTSTPPAFVPAAATPSPAAKVSASLAKTRAILHSSSSPAPAAPTHHQPERSPQPHPDLGGLDRD